jgi:hypothetical protein
MNREHVMRALFPAAVVAAVLSACASTPGAQPHAMSVAGHEAAAAQEETTAAQYEARIDWTSSRSPSAEDRAEMERLRKMAADHRAASKVLRDAEEVACASLSPDDRSMSPFEHYKDISSIEPIWVGARSRRLLGATIHFRAVPGLTKEWLQRLVDCHLARIAALGHDVPEMPKCPLIPRDVSARVSSSDGGFTVDIKSWDEESAREVWRRSRALVGAP